MGILESINHGQQQQRKQINKRSRGFADAFNPVQRSVRLRGAASRVLKNAQAVRQQDSRDRRTHRRQCSLNHTEKVSVSVPLYHRPVLRRRITISPEQATFIFADGVAPSTSSTLEQVDSKHRDSDGFLYLNYGAENSFG